MREVQLTRGYVALVDDADFGRVSAYTWRVSFSRGHAYAVTTIRTDGRYKTLSMHRLIVDAQPGETVDHQDGNGLDNRRSNIRVGTQAQNLANMKPRADTESGYKGVSRDKYPGRWRARIGGTWIGSFPSPEEAARAYDAKARELHGDFARTNFPMSAAPAPVRRITRSASGYRGVSFDRRINLYCAQLHVARRRHYLGSYQTADEAARAYDRAAVALLGSNAILNFPGESPTAT